MTQGLGIAHYVQEAQVAQLQKGYVSGTAANQGRAFRNTRVGDEAGLRSTVKKGEVLAIRQEARGHNGEVDHADDRCHHADHTHLEYAEWFEARLTRSAVQGSYRPVLVVRIMTEGSVAKNAELSRHLLLIDEFWSPNDFVGRTLISLGVPSERIVRIPAVLSQEYEEGHDESPSDDYLASSSSWWFQPADGFRFLSVFEWTDRKGWKALLEAFVREFRSSERVELLIKSNMQSRVNSAGMAERLQKIADQFVASLDPPVKDVPRIRIITPSLPRLKPLYKAADAFVLPSRGEGIGIPALEAMSCGLPVIATNATGLADFVLDETGFPVRFELYEVNETDAMRPDGGSVYMGSHMAFVNVDHLRSRMRFVYENPQASKVTAERGRRHVLEHHSSQSVSKLIAQRMQALLARVEEKNPWGTAFGINLFAPITRQTHIGRHSRELLRVFRKIDVPLRVEQVGADQHPAPFKLSQSETESPEFKVSLLIFKLSGASKALVEHMTGPQKETWENSWRILMLEHDVTIPLGSVIESLCVSFRSVHEIWTTSLVIAAACAKECPPCSKRIKAVDSIMGQHTLKTMLEDVRRRVL